MSNSNQNSNCHQKHRLRLKNKFINHGTKILSDHEVLELLLFFSIPRRNVNPIAHKLISHFGSFKSVFKADPQALKQVDGVGDNSAMLINLVGEILNKCNSELNIKMKLDSPETTMQYCKNLYTESNIEQFFAICLNPANKVICAKLLAMGTGSTVNVNIKDITDLALANKSERIIITHNHPNNKCMPSNEDLDFTKKIIFSCFLNDINVADHIIVSGKQAVSFSELGLMESLSKEVRSILCKTFIDPKS